MKMEVLSPVLLVAICSSMFSLVASLKEGECEVCVKVIQKFSDQLSDGDRSSVDKIQDKFRQYCKNLRGKEERFCYYIGGTDTAATGTLQEIARPLSYHKPPEKICETLKSKDMQICELRYDKEIDFAKVDFKKLKVKDLKKILDDWGESSACKGCAEKSDFVRVIKELLPKYAPDAAKKREEL